MCDHIDIDQIDAVLRRRRSGDQSLTALAGMTDLPYPSLYNHAKKHLDNVEYQQKTAMRELRRLASISRYVGVAS